MCAVAVGVAGIIVVVHEVDSWNYCIESVGGAVDRYSCVNDCDDDVLSGLGAPNFGEPKSWQVPLEAVELIVRGAEGGESVDGLHPIHTCDRSKDLPDLLKSSVGAELNGFVEANCAPEAVLAVLPQLVDALFKLMNDIGNEEVVQTLDNLIERYGEQMAPYA
mgnify:CR=1 FL=1